MNEHSNISSKNKKIKYLLGIDGGGTKTEFLLTDLMGNGIKRTVLKASNPINIGIKNTKTVLRQGIVELINDLDPSEISLFAGLAGGISADNKALLNDFLSSFGFGAFSNGSDTDNALAVSLKGEDGIMVIMGTGVVSFCQFDGKRHRAGGWGYLVDSSGSGFGFGADALNSAFKAYDGRGGSEMILKLIEEQLNMPVSDSVGKIYEQGPSFVSALAPVVFKAFAQGDKEAERIIQNNVKEVAELIRACGGFTKAEAVKTVICGGLTKQKEILEPFFKKELNNRYKIEFLQDPVINGAILLAGGNVC